MMKHMLIAASLALLMAGTAHAAEDSRRDKSDAERETSHLTRKKAPPPTPLPARKEADRPDRRSHGGADRDRDWRRDDDWRRRGWVYQGWRNDGWRYYRGHDHRHWRYVPPYRYTFDFGYRSGYELAWRDWLAYGRYDHYWRRPGYGYGGGYGYSAGYEAGWRDAAFYYARGYRPDYWAYDPQGGWYFSFRITG